MSQLFVDNIKNRSGGAVGAPSGAVVTGVVTATRFVGSGTSLTGIDATALKDSGGNIKVQANTSGIVVTGVSTFTANVSVGGTLTYEDVKNVDSVGLITARSGIRIGAGQSVSAVSGIVTYYGDGSQLTGVESGVSNFVASGTIANGQTVILKTDGTVTGVATAGAGTTFSPSATNYSGTNVCENHIATYDTAKDRVVIFYKDQTGVNGFAVVGTVSGTTITFGTPVSAISSRPAYHDACYDVASGKIVYAFRDDNDSDKGAVLIGTVDASNNSISFGSKVVFESSGPVSWPEIAYDVNAQKVVIAYSQGSSYAGKAIVGTVVGNSMTFGSIATLATRPYGKDIVYHEAAQKVVVFYKDDNSNKGKAKVGTVNGTSITFGSEAEFESGSIDSSWVESSYDPVNEKVVVIYNSSNGKANVGTVSGTSITFGTSQVFSSGSTAQLAVVYDVNAAKTIIIYNTNSDGKIRESTISATTITFGDEVTWTPLSQEYPGATYNTSQGAIVIGFKNPSNSGRGDAIVYKAEQISTNLTAENYIGIAAEAIANTATGKVNILGGVNTGQTGLTTAKTYYVQPGGSLATSVGNPSVVAGTSVSNTKILIR
jgi:hypothetical protein